MNIFAWHVTEWLDEGFLLCKISFCGIGISILLQACGRGMQRECAQCEHYVCSVYFLPINKVDAAQAGMSVFVYKPNATCIMPSS